MGLGSINRLTKQLMVYPIDGFKVLVNAMLCQNFKGRVLFV